MEVRPRPRFERHTIYDFDALRERLTLALEQRGGTITGEVLDSHAQFMIEKSRRHTWSPYLSLTFTPIETDGPERLRIRGLFGPNPAVWTLVATLYGLSAFITFIGIVVGWSQLVAESSPTGFFAIAAGGLLAVVLYLLSLSGQTLAQEQMQELANLIDGAIGDDDSSA